MRWWIVGLTLIAGCSGSTRELVVVDADPGTLPAPSTQLAAVDEPWVEFEARWVCDLERSTYDDPAEVEEALAERILDNDIDPDDYEEFKRRLGAEPDLAAHVQAAVIDRCGD